MNRGVFQDCAFISTTAEATPVGIVKVLQMTGQEVAMITNSLLAPLALSTMARANANFVTSNAKPATIVEVQIAVLV